MARKLAAFAVLGALFLFPALTAWPCHVPQHLRDEEPSLTAAQLALMAHGGADREQIPYSIEVAQPCVDGMADVYPCSGVDLLEVVQLPSIGGGTGNDLWGWRDPVTGKQYALVGRSNGTAFVDISDPENPVYVANLPTHANTSTWRDIKTYQDHAYIVADFAGAHGMQVVDLTVLRNVKAPPVELSNTAHYDGFARAHNVVINEETGFAYAVGGNTCSGGLHMIDIRQPASPTFAGCFSADGYTHDAQCVIYRGPDVKHKGKELCFASNEDTVTIVDVTNKAEPVQLSRNGYEGRGYTHQGWLTEDHRYFVHDDEIDEQMFGHNTKTYVWDLSDLENPVLTGTFLADGLAIDHNQYVKGQHTYQANYRRGLRILELEDPAGGRLSEAAFFDTYPEGDGLSFSGAWSVYPFLGDGLVLVSDINRGLFILRTHLQETIFEDGFESGGAEGWDSTVASKAAPVAAPVPAPVPAPVAAPVPAAAPASAPIPAPGPVVVPAGEE